MTEHTATPWETNGDMMVYPKGTPEHWRKQRGHCVAVIPYNPADAAFIVRACNAHDDLLAACKALVEYRDRAGALGFQLEKADDYINGMRAAIAAAEEGQG